MTPMPTVYLISQPSVSREGKTPDLTPLRKWGEVRTVVLAGESPRYYPDRMIETIADRLIDFDPDTDFLAWAGGDTLAAVMVGALLATFFHDTKAVTHYTWLRFERRRGPDGRRVPTDEGGKYVPVRVPLYVKDDEPAETPQAAM